MLAGLRRLEYRGYDSAGIVTVNDGQFDRVRSVGNIDKLESEIKEKKLRGASGIGHTRWATHGAVTLENAHPQYGPKKEVAVVHNGIIENYKELKERYLEGNQFVSQTDTEVIAHLIEKFTTDLPLKEAVEKTLSLVRGTYGLGVISVKEPDKIIVARLGSPFVIGVGKDEYFAASDVTPILSHTRDAIYLDDGEYAVITKDNCQIFRLDKIQNNKKPEKIEWNIEEAEKSGYDHFMLKEIFDQPTVLKDAIRGRTDLADGTAHLGGLNIDESQIKHINKIFLVACGTASHAALIGKYAFERLSGIATEVDVGSEFRYRDPVIDENTLVFAISQSGETADTLAALREAKRRGAFVRGIVNVIGSTIARETEGGTYIHAGPELAVATTKAYTNQVAVLLLYALQFGRSRRLSLATGKRILEALSEISGKIDSILKQSQNIKNIAIKYKDYRNFLFLGRGINYPVALEGSHKLKEISYIHSEAYPAGEMKHGANALLTPDFPVMAIMTKNQSYEKMRSNIEEVRARKAPVILIATEGDEKAKEISEDIIYVPETSELLEPLLNTIPLQLFAYHMAVLLGRDVDRPRNLAKSVTVE